MKLNGKSVVVTGASSGMGKAIVELFVKEGASVIAVARRKERLEALADSLKGESGRMIAFAGDVSKREDDEAMIDLAVKEFGKLDILVNNAGVMDDMAPMAQASDEKYEYVMGINVYGPLASMRKACQVFLEQGNGGNIINISSVGSMHQAAGPVYCASKAAVNAMSKNVAFLYMKEGIRCNVIAPGGINTEIGTAHGDAKHGWIWAAPAGFKPVSCPWQGDGYCTGGAVPCRRRLLLYQRRGDSGGRRLEFILTRCRFGPLSPSRDSGMFAFRRK